MLSIDSLYVSYGGIDALRDVSMTLRGGEIVALLGANGAGKSTLLRTIVGFVRSRSGRIEFRSRDLTAARPLEIVRLGIVLCPEGRELFGGLTVLENLKLGATRTGLPWHRLKVDLDRVIELFPVIGQRLHQRSETLSGGEQQMVAVSRALLARPILLLIDEPSLGLAPTVARKLFAALRDIMHEDCAILIVEQNAGLALSIADRAFVLKTGQIVSKGTADEVRSSYMNDTAEIDREMGLQRTSTLSCGVSKGRITSMEVLS